MVLGVQTWALEYLRIGVASDLWGYCVEVCLHDGTGFVWIHWCNAILFWIEPRASAQIVTGLLSLVPRSSFVEFVSCVERWESITGLLLLWVSFLFCCYFSHGGRLIICLCIFLFLLFVKASFITKKKKKKKKEKLLTLLSWVKRTE